MEGMVLSFTAREGQAVITNSGAAACIVGFDGRVSVELFYSFSPEPLRLAAEAEPDDAVRLYVYPHRIGLYVNGELADEEWPCGNCLLSDICVQTGDIPVVIAPLETKDELDRPPSPRSCITTAEIRRPCVNIGDCMPYSDESGGDGLYHLFYLYDRHHHTSKWHLGAHQWAHVATKDFRLWKEYPMVVPITRQWEGSICTGSVIRCGDLWYAWYAVRMADRSPSRLTCAVSDDLVHFEKNGDFFTIPEGYDPGAARDPMLFVCGRQYHMLVTTRLLSDGSGCLAHLVNDEMAITGWRDAGCIMRWNDWCTHDSPEWNKVPECADWFHAGGYYYLVFGIASVSRYLFSKSPFGPWTCPEDNKIPCGAVPKSAVLPGTDRRVFMGFVGEGGYAGSLCAAEAFQNPDGTLRFKQLIP
ncbi:MAG: hypothetical protein K5784_00520 [Clostridiales bacterium]|jgi:hypothetical protein|nr:hypothetical protein [Clostridiales bacterium]